MVEKEPEGTAYFKREEGEARPPLEAEAGAEVGAEAEAEARVGALRAGKVPLHPAFVRLPLRAEGALLSHFTGFPGFEYDEATLNDLGEMAQQLDIQLNPMWQFVVALLSVHAVKALGFLAWRRAGKPKFTKAGEIVREEKE